MAIQLNYLEKDIEDVLEEHSETLLGLAYVSRQFRTPVGVVDMIVRANCRHNLYYVIEIKKDVIDASACVQAWRYTRWLNSELSKNGRRLFVPLLIGQHLHGELSAVCEYFNNESGWFDLIGRSFYRLFNFDPMQGVTFIWQSTGQQKHADSLKNQFSHSQSLWQRADRLAGDNYRLLNGQKPRGGIGYSIFDDQDDADLRPSLRLVKPHGVSV